MTDRFHYAMELTLQPAPGHIASASLRDALEHALAGALEKDDEVSVELTSDGRLSIAFALQTELKDHARIGLRAAAEDQISGAILSDERFDLSALTLRAYPSRRP